MQIKIIYQDADIVVVHKPAGLATQTARVGQPDVVSELKKELKTAYLGVISRLDQPVEGLLVFAKNKKAAAALTRQLETGELRKHYAAIVCGKPAEPRGCYVDYLTKTRENTAEVYPEQGSHPADAKRAVLHYEVMDAAKCAAPQCEAVDTHDAKPTMPYCPAANANTVQQTTPHCEMPEAAKESCTLLDITIDTGRFHQIRAQLAAHGLPLLGDRKYNTPESLALTRETHIANVALCAYRLELRHPATGRERSWQITPEGEVFRGFKAEG